MKKEIKKVLDKYSNYGIWYFMPVPYGYGKQALDFIGFFFGRGFAIEAKAPGKAPTPRQDNTIEYIRASRARVFVIDGTKNTDTIELLDAWFSSIKNADG